MITSRLASFRRMEPTSGSAVRKESHGLRRNCIFGSALASRPESWPNRCELHRSSSHRCPGPRNIHEENPRGRYRRHAREDDDFAASKEKIRLWDEPESQTFDRANQGDRRGLEI